MTKEQAFLANGSPANGIAFDRDEFNQHPEYLMGTVHLWVWRRSGKDVEILLQKRSLSKKTHPGMLDISVAGHIDQQETNLKAVKREAKEEIGLDVDEDALTLIFCIRKTNVSNVIASVFVYEVDKTFLPNFDDGEVESSSWISLKQFSEMIESPEAHNLAPHGTGYFTVLLERMNLL